MTAPPGPPCYIILLLRAWIPWGMYVRMHVFVFAPWLLSGTYSSARRQYGAYVILANVCKGTKLGITNTEFSFHLWVFLERAMENLISALF